VSTQGNIHNLLPEINEVNKPFYDNLNQGKLSGLHCKRCGNTFLPPSVYCPRCLSDQLEWVLLSGEGEIYSWVEYHYAYHEYFKDKLPYVVAIVQLKEGPRIVSNIVDYDLEKLKVGAPVKAVFQNSIVNQRLVQFKLTNSI